MGWGGCSLKTHEQQNFQLYFEMVILGVCRHSSWWGWLIKSEETSGKVRPSHAC